MRINLPVTDQEYVLPDDAMLVSSTDLKGVITHCNPAFVEASGYSEKELLGAPHNLVRHPDMPAEAFEDMWRTVKSGKPWSAVVKNRRKNGGFYWVLANATPLYEGDKITGYMSVRNKPGAEQVAAASALYESMRKGTCAYRLVEGALVRKGWLHGALHRVLGMGVRGRILGLSSSICFAMFVLLLHMMWGLNMLDAQATVARGDMVNINKATDTALRAEVSFRRQVQEWKDIMLNGNDAEAHQSHYAEFGQKARDVQQLLLALAPMMETIGGSKTDVEHAIEDHATLTQRYEEALRSGGSARFDGEGMDRRLRGADKPLSASLDKIAYQIEEQGNRKIAEIEAAAKAKMKGLKRASWMDAAIILAGSIFFSLLLVRHVSTALVRAREALVQIARGNFKNDIGAQHPHEMGQMLNAMRSLQTKVGFDVVDARRVADENLRIKIGLDNVSTSVMISDTERKIIYMNPAVEALMRAAEQDIRKNLPDFRADQLLGSSIDVFHRNPQHQKAMLEQLSGTHRTQIVVGGRTFALAASPVLNSKGQRLGAVLEWKDRTAEVAVENEVAEVVEGAVRGDFARRLAMQGKEGFFRKLSEDINRLMEVSDQGLQEVVRMLEAMARGDLTDRITSDYEGTFGQLKDDSNATAEKLSAIIHDIKLATDTINTAAQEIASGNSDLSQRTEQQASTLEETASSMEELTSTVKQNAENAKQANQLALGASGVASKGGVVVGQVVTTMDSINESSRKIVDIISVIDGIAFQTNILALNAAVEAARAGEQGRGFAVVAGEVRNLAQRSAAAAKEIKTLIEDSVSKIENGSKLVGEAGSTMEEIVTSIKRVTDIMSEITAASVEQSAGIEQVNLAITQMDEVTQQNAALVEEAAAAAESLEEQAQNLSVSVATFRVDESDAVPGRAGQRAAHPAAAHKRIAATRRSG